MRSTGVGVGFNFGRILTAVTIFATGALIDLFAGDYARIGRVTSLVFAVGMLAPCLALGYLTIAEYSHFLFLAPLTGFVWSACLLIYGRLLGRVAWVVTGGHELSQRETRPRRKRRR